LVITRIPEPGTTDYVRSQRLTALWFGWNVREYDSNEIGARFKRRHNNALPKYLEEMDEVFTELTRVLKPGRWCALVLGLTIHKKGLADELSRLLNRKGLATMPRIGGRSRVGHRSTPPPSKEEIMIARKDD
jgi:hypothetical protein